MRYIIVLALALAGCGRGFDIDRGLRNANFNHTPPLPTQQAPAYTPTKQTWCYPLPSSGGVMYCQ